MADASVPPPSTRPFRPPRRSHAPYRRPLRFAAGVSAGVLVAAAAVALGL